MSIFDTILGRRTSVSGEIGTFRIVLTASGGDRNSDSDPDEKLYYMFREDERNIRRGAERLVRNTLGSNVQIVALDVHRGSVEILITIGTAYYVISRWKNFVESIQLLLSQLKSFLEKSARNYFGRRAPAVSVQAIWVPGPAIAAFTTSKENRSFAVGGCVGFIVALLLTYFLSFFSGNEIEKLDERLETVESDITDNNTELLTVKNSINRLLLFQDTAIELQLRDIRSTNNGLEDIRNVLESSTTPPVEISGATDGTSTASP